MEPKLDARGLQEKLKSSFTNVEGQDVPLDVRKIITEYRSIWGKLDFLKLNRILSNISKKIDVPFLTQKFIPEVFLVFDESSNSSGLYFGDKISLNLFNIESEYLSLQRLYPNKPPKLLKEICLLKVYVHELMHHYSDSFNINKTIGFEVRIKDDRLFVAYNEAITELLAQYVFDKYMENKADVKFDASYIAYFDFSFIVRELLYLSIELSGTELSGSAIERAWFFTVKDYFDPNKLPIDNFMYQLVKWLGRDFATKLISLGQDNLSLLEEDSVMDELLLRIREVRLGNGLQEFAFPIAA